MAKPSNCTADLHGRKEIENQSGSSDNIWERRFNIDEKLWKKTSYVRLSL